MSNGKPLFVPLTAEHYDRFESGHKNTEYRLLGPRWNGKTCYKDRPVVLSRGYGKQRRIRTRITGTVIIPYKDLPDCIQTSLQSLYSDLTPDREIIAIKMAPLERIEL